MRRFLPFAALASVALVGAGSLAASSPSDSPTVATTLPATTPPDSPDAGDVSDAAEQSAAATYRIEMFMSMAGMGIDLSGDTPLMTGEVAGTQSHMVMDFGAMFGELIPEDQMPPELAAAGFTMEFVTDGTDMYIRSPLLAMTAASGDPSTAPFAELGDRWGYVDGTAVPGMSPTDISGSMGVGGADPSAFLDLLAEVAEVTPIGTESIRGVDASGVSAEVDLGALLEAQGTAAMPAGGPDLGDVTFPIEVWIDKDSFVRRIVMELNGEAIAGAAEASGEEISGSELMGGVEIGMTMEMFDYAAADIAIEIPTDVVDITQAFTDMMAQPGG